MCKKCDCSILMALCDGFSELFLSDDIAGLALELELHEAVFDVLDRVSALRDKAQAVYALKAGQMH